jgi:hypothetical protein
MDRAVLRSQRHRQRLTGFTATIIARRTAAAD